jgi:hypothetical protein
VYDHPHVTALRCSLVVLALLVSTAHADSVRSYAYITDASAIWATNDSAQVDRCQLTGKLPSRIVARRPAHAAPELLHGATRIQQTIEDEDHHCDEFAHTWQRVIFDAAHPKDARYVLPKKHASTTILLLMVGAEVILLAAVKEWIGKLRAALRGRA